MAKSPLINQQSTELSSFKVFINGAILSNATEFTRIEVTKEINRISVASLHIVVNELFRSAHYKNFQELGFSDKFKPGNEVEIKSGYVNQGEATIFKGIITKIGVKLNSTDHDLFVVECADKAIKMTLDRRNRYYLKKKDDQIISQVISEYGLQKTVKACSYQHKEVVQYNASDWDFIMSRAEINRLIVVNDDNKIDVKGLGSTISVKVTQGVDAIKANLNVNGKSQIKSIKASAWDFNRQKLIFQKSTEPSEGPLRTGNYAGTTLANEFITRDYEMHITSPVETAFLKSWADARLFRSRMARITGTLTVHGMAEIKPDTLVEIHDFGKSFDGNQYISKVHHEISNGAWVSEITIGISNEWFTEVKPVLNSPIAAGMLPGITGLYNAVVKQIHEDPDGEYRVKVNIPVIEASEDIWARLSNFYASNTFGDFFYPEIGDEVLLGFLQGDPQYPIILGSLYSAKNKPAYSPDQPNTFKAIVTKSKMKIEFEDVKKILIIETPGGRRVTLSDDGKFLKLQDPEKSSEIRMDTDGITLKTNGKITLDAMQDVSLTSSTGKIALKATTDVTIDANANITASAMMQATFKSSANTTLSSSGMVTINGTMVKIN